jgi:hypothetical protein
MDQMKELVTQYIKENDLMVKRRTKEDKLLWCLLKPYFKYHSAGKCAKILLIKAVAAHVIYSFTVT